MSAVRLSMPPRRRKAPCCTAPKPPEPSSPSSEFEAFQTHTGQWAVEHLTTGYIYGIRFNAEAQANAWIAGRAGR